MGTLYMCGGGNSEGVRLAMVCNDHAQRWDQIVVLDDDPSKQGGDLIGVPVVGGFDVLAQADPETDQVVNLVARTTRGRASARERIAGYGVPFTNLVHPNVDTFRAELASEVIVYNNATIGPEIRLGMGCVVFMGAVVGHECQVADGCVMAANSVLNARVRLGERVYVGTNSTVLPEIEIGPDATVAAGSVVIRDLESDDTAIGVPADSINALAVDTHTAATASLDAAEVTELVTQIWREMLGVQDPSPSANFFDLGGNSVLAIKMQDAVSAATATHLATTDVFRFPTIETLVVHLSGPGDAAEPIGHRRAEARRQAMRQPRRIRV